MNFSERSGIKQIKTIMQIESVDDSLRIGLWNLLNIHVWEYIVADTVSGKFFLGDNKYHKIICRLLWQNYFNKPLDNLSNQWDEVFCYLHTYYFRCEWYEIYDFIEFIANNFNRPNFKNYFLEECNALLKKECSAYRFVDCIIASITDEHEIGEIELAKNSSQTPVRNHINRSLELLSDRKSPDYRNSIKESISAVESLVKIILKEENGTLGQLLKKLEDTIGLHPALKSAFTKLYGYTSDEEGIRHSMTDKENVDFNDAKFMLVICSSFVNFIEGKTKE
ncbi:MAG: hypothetical protein HOC18_05335 [Candidatus Marinimicrobia bacterium]|nr:hypothetical protein [Candidatus Neomarinimicrobiota bacterium]